MSLLDVAQARKSKLRDGYSDVKAGVDGAATRVEYGVAQGASSGGYVSILIDGSDSAFTVPCDSTIRNGDRVSYISTGGSGKAVSLYGNTAEIASAQSAADAAAAIAEATDQYFWHDSNGAHVSTTADTAAGDQNIIMNSNGVLLRQQSKNLAAFTPTSVAFYDGNGNDAANIVAQFGADGAQVGSETSSRVIVTKDAIDMLDDGGNVIAEMAKTSTSMSDTATKSAMVPPAGYGSVDITLSNIASASTFTVGFGSELAGGQTFTQGTAATKTVTYSGFTMTAAYNGASKVTLTMTVGSAAPAFVEYATSSVYPPAFTFGTRTGSKGAFSMTAGRSLRALSDSSFACGQFNASQDYPFQVGTGTDDSHRFTGFAVTRYGTAAVRSSNITSGTVPASDTTGEAVVVFRDSAGTNIGTVGPRFIHDGGFQTMQFYATRNIGGTDYYNMLRLGIDGSGNRSVSISEVAPWLSALHIGAATLRNGGASITTSSTFTVPTQFTSSYLVSSNSSLFSHSGTTGTYPYGIKCLVTGYVEISGGYYVASLASPGSSASGAAIQILRDGTVFGEFTAPYTSTNAFAEPVFPPRVIAVTANQTIQLAVKTTTAGTIAASRCFLTVKYVG